MRFFKDRRGDCYSIADIKRIGRKMDLRDGDHARFHVVRMSDDAELAVAEYVIDEILRTPTTIVPAPPGTFLLGGVDITDTSPADVWQTPVVAFAISEDNMVTPWTADGPDDGDRQQHPILFENGMVVDQAIRSYRSIREWFDVQMEDARQSQNASSAATAPGTAD